MRQGSAVILERPGLLQIRELDIPAPNAGAIVARVLMGGVCGTDVHLLKGEYPLPYPIVLGHEGVGVIEELGDGLNNDYTGVPVQPGDLIYWCPIAPCHHCWYCVVEKDFSSCENSTWFGPTEKPTWGSYAEYVTLPPNAAFFRIPDGTPPEAVIAFGCALPAVLQGLDRLGGIAPSESVVVQGCGPIGLSAIMMARLSGAAEVIAIDSSDLRLALAKRFGASTTISLTEVPEMQERRTIVESLTSGRGAGTVIEGSGHRSAFNEGLGLLARNGRYLLIGLWASQGEVQFDPSAVVQRNLKLIGTQYAQATHYYAAMMVASRHHRRFPFSEVITHRCPLDQATEALQLVSSGGAGKVVMTPGL